MKEYKFVVLVDVAELDVDTSNKLGRAFIRASKPMLRAIANETGYAVTIQYPWEVKS